MKLLKRLIPLLLLLAPLLAPCPSFAAFVQGTSGLTTSSATSVTSGSITVTAGNTVVVWSCVSTSGNPFSAFSDSVSDAFTGVVSFNTSGNQSCNAAIIANAIGGATTFTGSTTGVNSNLMYIGAAEFSGRSGAFEQLGGGAISTPFVSTHATPTTLAAVGAGDDVVALICDVVGPVSHVETFTATGSWTATAVQNGNGTTGDLPLGMMMYQANVAAASYTATYTTFTNVQSANVIFGLPPEVTTVSKGMGLIL